MSEIEIEPYEVVLGIFVRTLNYHGDYNQQLRMAVLIK